MGRREFLLTATSPDVEGAIAMGEHSFGVHPCHDRRFLVHGFMEGVHWYPKKTDGPDQPRQIPFARLYNLAERLATPLTQRRNNANHQIGETTTSQQRKTTGHDESDLCAHLHRHGCCVCQSHRTGSRSG